MDKGTLDKIHKSMPADWFDQGATCNLIQYYWHKKRLQIASKLLEDIDGDLLDIGCHSGWMTNLLSKSLSGRTTGIDISEKAIKLGQTKYPDLDFLVADLDDGIAYPSASFDIITAFDVIEHIFNLEKLVNDIARVLKSNGYLIIGMPSENLLFKISWFIWTHTKGRSLKEVHINHFHDELLNKTFDQRRFSKILDNKIHLGMWRIIKYRRR